MVGWGVGVLDFLFSKLRVQCNDGFHMMMKVTFFFKDNSDTGDRTREICFQESKELKINIFSAANIFFFCLIPLNRWC